MPRKDIWDVQDKAKMARQIREAAMPLAAEHQFFNGAHGCGVTFFTWHRRYLAKLEKRMDEITGKPGFRLPAWDPWNAKPSRRYVCPEEFLLPASPLKDRIHQPTPPMPFDIFHRFRGDRLRDFDDPDRLACQVTWGPHFYIHSSMGGVMADVPRAAEAAIFWPWHAFVDTLWEEWERLHPPSDGKARVPDLVWQHFHGSDTSVLEQTLQDVGLRLGGVRFRRNDPGHHHIVTAQQPEGGATVDRGTGVKVYVDGSNL